jgi:hypothetical protein
MSAVNRISGDLKEANSGANGHASAVAAEAVAEISGDVTKASPAKDGRYEQGRFTKGNAGGPGNPYARRTAELRRAILAAVITNEDIEVITAKLIEQAKEGDVPSAKLLFSYALGKPAEAVEPDAVDFHEWELYCRQPVGADQVNLITHSMPVAMMSEIMRYVLPCVVASSKSKLLAMMQAEDEEAAAVKSKNRGGGKAQPKGGTGISPVRDRRGACATGIDASSGAEGKSAGAGPSAKGAKGDEPGETGELTSSARQGSIPRAAQTPIANGGNGSTGPGKRPNRAARILTSGLTRRPGP